MVLDGFILTGLILWLLVSVIFSLSPPELRTWFERRNRTALISAWGMFSPISEAPVGHYHIWARDLDADRADAPWSLIANPVYLQKGERWYFRPKQRATHQLVVLCQRLRRSFPVPDRDIDALFELSEQVLPSGGTARQLKLSFHPAEHCSRELWRSEPRELADRHRC
jgi:hypothetical protein